MTPKQSAWSSERAELTGCLSEVERLLGVSDGLAALTESHRRICSVSPSGRTAELRERLACEETIVKELRRVEAAERLAVDALRLELMELQAGVREAEDEKHRMLALIETKREHWQRIQAEMAARQSRIMPEHAATLRKLQATSEMMQHDDAEMRSVEVRVAALRDAVCEELVGAATALSADRANQTTLPERRMLPERRRLIELKEALLSESVYNEYKRKECEAAKADLALLLTEASRQRNAEIATIADSSMLAAIDALEREKARLGQERSRLSGLGPKLEPHRARLVTTRIEIEAGIAAAANFADRVEAQADTMRRCGLKQAEVRHSAQMSRIAAIHQTLQQSLALHVSSCSSSPAQSRYSHST
jgi:hypothetical protein